MPQSCRFGMRRVRGEFPPTATGGHHVLPAWSGGATFLVPRGARREAQGSDARRPEVDVLGESGFRSLFDLED
jgi:hypothetical protein